jgi:ketosteroid isomerase-like protein
MVERGAAPMLLVDEDHGQKLILTCCTCGNILHGMSKENIELVRRLVEAFDNGDRDRIADALAPDGVIVSKFAGSSLIQGPDGARASFRGADEEWQGFDLETTEIRDLGDKVLVLGRIAGERKHGAGRSEAQAGWLVTLEDGKIRRIDEYLGWDAARAAAGLSS